jgi:DNA repair protein RadD
VALSLRPYQEQAVKRTVEHFRRSTEPACLVLPTGAGKSLVIAALARLAKGRVLVLAHVKELCEQNFLKYDALVQRSGAPGAATAGLYSAGLGVKNASERVTFASIQSVQRNLADFGQPVSLVVIDECHRVSGEQDTQYGQVIDHLRKVAVDHGAPSVKILGLTATPYRMGMGWVYQRHARGVVRAEGPRPFAVCLYEVSLRHMIAQGYLTPPVVEDAPIAQYDFSAIDPDPFGRLPTREVNALLVRHRRVTESIVRQVVALAEEQGRRGVMIFAATVEHAKEIACYLPEEQTALILGETDDAKRDAGVAAFSEQRLRYLVNVSVLTTGFDAPHVDLIALLRPTGSVSLFQQIVGRGLRLHPEKRDCLVIDYAGNGFDVFAPEVGERKPTTDSVVVPVTCPACAFENAFWGRVDENGHVVEHFGRRCAALVGEEGKQARCSFRFRFKECEGCGAENDIAARRCGACAAPLVDPDEQLRKALGLKDGLVLRVAAMSLRQDGRCLEVTYHDEDGTSVRERFDFGNGRQRYRFNREFGRRIASGRRPLELEAPEQALTLETHLPTPDFVIARKQKGRKSFLRVEARIFDYEGRRRKADRAASSTDAP